MLISGWKCEVLYIEQNILFVIYMLQYMKL